MHWTTIVASLAVLWLSACQQGAPETHTDTQETSEVLERHLETVLEEASPVSERLNLSEEQWRDRLSDEQFRVLRRGGTERAFTGDLWDHHGIGTYHCAGCGAPLFSSATKYESGTGWPSFYDVVQEGRVEVRTDRSHGMIRQEILCARCGGHLGHIFPDGPQPTGQRYCVNSASLAFESANE